MWISLFQSEMKLLRKHLKARGLLIVAPASVGRDTMLLIDFNTIAFLAELLWERISLNNPVLVVASGWTKEQAGLVSVFMECSLVGIMLAKGHYYKSVMMVVFGSIFSF